MSKKISSDFRFNVNVSRRSFLRRASFTGAGTAGLATTMNHLGVMEAAANNTTLPLPYKALVCIFLRGGCDMNNMLIPVQGNSQNTNYYTDRGVSAVPEFIVDEVLTGNPPAPLVNSIERENTYISNPPSVSGGTEPFALHSSCKNMTTMFNTGELGFVANCGNLSEPVTQAEYLAGSATLPVQLFSHSDQVTEWMAGSEPEKPFNSGWAGRLAKLYGEANPVVYNTLSQSSMLTTIAGNNDFMISPGGSVPQYSVTTAGAIRIVGYGPAATPYVNALDGSNKYINNNTGRRLRAFEDIMRHRHRHYIEQGYNSVVKRARENETLIGEALTFTTPGHPNDLGVDLDAIFHGPVNPPTSFGVATGSNVGLELKMIARLIAGRHCLGNDRQIFFCDQGGYDTHQDINGDQPDLLEDLDRSVGAFNEAIRQLALADPSLDYNDVLTFQASDFNRTWTPNGSDPLTSGTDHAWGTNCFVFGGDVNGGDFYGTFPTLAKGSPDDVSDNTASSRGRWIPTTAVDQYSAVIADWFGVSSSDMNTILPSLGNFPLVTDPAANLGFI